jgi:aminopeptidase N
LQSDPRDLPPRATVDTDAGGPLRPGQAAFDVRFYDLDLEVDAESRSLQGSVTIRATAVDDLEGLDLDLDDRLQVEAVRLLDEAGEGEALAYRHEGKRLWVELPAPVAAGGTVEVEVAYGGSPREAPNPPWEGGFTWERTADDEPWVGVSCQIDGCDLWWPCKDHPSDEPDEGAALHYTVAEDLTVAANGVLESVDDLGDGRRTWHWRVSSPINAYNITFNAAPFEILEADYTSVTGEPIPFSYYVLPEDLDQGRELLPELVEHVAFLEDLLGPYPFRADKYSVVETPYLAMEHQTVIAYGRAFGAKRMGFTYIALHELIHEWWGNLVTASDWRDFWLHEGFDSYTEALYAEHLHGHAAYHEYLARFTRPGLINERPVAPREPRSIRQVYYAIPPSYEDVDRDAPAKGAMVLHTLRYLLGDETFFELLRRQAYPSPELEAVSDGSHTRIESSDDFIARAEQISGRDLGWFFELYLRQPVLPRLVREDGEGVVTLSWAVPDGLDFPMPVEVEVTEGAESERVEIPAGQTVSVEVTNAAQVVVDPEFWILREEAPDPAIFGLLGIEGAGIREALREGPGAGRD